MIKTDKRVTQFIGESVIKYGSKLIEFHPIKKFKGSGMSYVGCASKDLLQVATGGNFEDWFQTFIHETCHLDQHKERSRWFYHRQTKVYKFDEWLSFRSEDLNWSDVVQILELEHDCETRSLLKIQKENLPVDAKIYAQKANHYLTGYQRAFKSRKWVIGKKGVWKKQPEKLIPLEELIV